MSAWAIDESLEVDGHIELRSRRRVSIARGDSLVAFKRLRREREVRFLWHARVFERTEARAPTASDEEAETVVTLRLSDVVHLEDEGQLLSDLAYSLACIYRYDSPERHFRLRYRRLPDDDLETIATGAIFWARTSLGLVLNSLPRPVALEFIASWMANVGHVPRSTVDLREAWNKLSAFIDQEYLAAVPLLREIARFAGDAANSKHGIQGFNLGELELRDDSGVGGSLLMLHALFDDLGSREHAVDGGVLRALTERMSSDSERRLVDVFGEREWPWPLQLEEKRWLTEPS